MKVKFCKPHTHCGQPVELNKEVDFPDALHTFFVNHKLGEVITPPAGYVQPEEAPQDGAEQEKPPAKPPSKGARKKTAQPAAE